MRNSSQEGRGRLLVIEGLDGSGKATQARKLAETHNAAALAALREFGGEADFLCQMAKELLTRRK